MIDETTLQSEPSQPEVSILTGEQLANSGKIREAIDLYTCLIRRGRNEEIALTRRGQLFRETFQLADAESDFRRALSINNDLEDALLNLGFILRDSRRIRSTGPIY